MAASYHRSYSSTDQVGEEAESVKGSSLPYHSLNLAEPHLHEGTTLKRYQSSGCCRVEERAALRMVTAWMVIVAIAVFVALVVEIITQEHVIEVGDIVSDHYNCSKIGSEILGLGGNAVDAAVAAGICLAVTVPHQAGIGGGGVMLIYQHRKNKTVVIDFLETSPSSLNVSSYTSSPSLGLESVGVPGLVAGLAMAWQKYGSHEVRTDCCSWLDLVWPTVKLLQEGFQVTEHWNKSAGSLDSLDTNTQLRQFVMEGGYSRNGAFNANISRVVKQIALDRSSFYKSELGSLGQVLVRDLDGHISSEDILNYRAEDESRTPLVETIQNKYRVLSTPAPTAGPELLALLNTMEDIASDCGETYNSAKYLASLREALESIGGYQALLGDPILNEGDIPIANITLDMLDKANKERWLSKKWEGPGLENRRPLQSGAHAAVMDRKDNYVSMVLSLGSAFGSQQFSQGILLNNALSRFSPPDGSGGDGTRTANQLGPGKRSLSSAAPVIAVDTQDLCGNRLVTGGMQAEAVAQVLGPVLLCSAGSLLDSQRGPRLVLNGSSVVSEEGMRQDIREKLEKTEAIEILSPPYSTVNALEKVQDSIHGFSDKVRSGVNGYITLRPTLVQTDNVDYTLYG